MGADTEAFSSKLSCKMQTLNFTFVPNLLWSLVLVWLVALFIMFAGVKKVLNYLIVFYPPLVVMFTILVVQSRYAYQAQQRVLMRSLPQIGRQWQTRKFGWRHLGMSFSQCRLACIMVTYASYLKRNAI